MSTETEPKPIRNVWADPEVTVLGPDPYGDAPGIDHIRWAIAFECAINYSEDFDQIGDGRGLHVSVHTRNDVHIRKVTPAQLRAHAEHLLGLAERAEARTAAQIEAAK